MINDDDDEEDLCGRYKMLFYYNSNEIEMIMKFLNYCNF